MNLVRKHLCELSVTFIFCFILTVHGIASANKEPKATYVISDIVSQNVIQEIIEALGTTKAFKSIILTPSTTEKISKINFIDGQTVSAGDILVELNQQEEQAQIKSAKAVLQESKQAFERAEKLMKNKDISDAVFMERKTDLLESEAKVVELQARINNLNITAPFDGVIGLSDISLGTQVAPGDIIATLDNIKQIRVDFDLSEKYFSIISIGQTIKVMFSAFPERIYQGVVTSIDTRVDPNSRAFTVRSFVQNDDLALKPGMLATVKVLLEDRIGIVIPAKSLVPDGKDDYVFVIDPAKKNASRKKVQVGKRFTDRVEILDGLNLGDMIVSEGQLKLQDNSIVDFKLSKQAQLTEKSKDTDPK